MTTDTDLSFSIWEQAQFTADLCVKCNICTSHCPVSNVTDLFPGPKFVGPQAQRFRNPFDISVDQSVDYCNGCGVCTMVCPHGVKVAEMNAKGRAKLYQRETIPLRNRMLGRSEILGMLGSPFAPIANFFLNLGLIRLVMEFVIGIHRRAPMPAFSFQTFRGWYKGIYKKSGRALKSDKKVVFFHGCSSNYYEPHVGKAALAILEHNGFEVIIPPQVCCGLPMISNAEFDAAHHNADKNIESLAPYAAQGLPIIGTGSSCVLTLKSDYRHILDIETGDSALVARQTYDISEFLLELAEKGELRTDFQRVEMTIPYHAQCQLKAHNMGLPAIDLMGLIPGVTVDYIQADCCGIAGTYGFKKEKFDIAKAVGEPVFNHIKESGAEVAACDSETCRWNIHNHTGAQMIHPIELLAKAYGLQDF